MLIPKGDKVREQAHMRAVKAFYEFFTKIRPTLTKERELHFDEEKILTLYSLASSDNEYAEMLSQMWDINLDEEVPNVEELRRLLSEQGVELNVD